MPLSLEGKVALVSGGSRGIGAAIARKLAQDGADVALTYASAGSKARAVVAKSLSEKFGMQIKCLPGGGRGAG